MYIAMFHLQTLPFCNHMLCPFLKNKMVFQKGEMGQVGRSRTRRWEKQDRWGHLDFLSKQRHAEQWQVLMRHSRTETPPGRAVNEQDGVKKVNTAPERVAIGQTSHITIYNTKNIKKILLREPWPRETRQWCLGYVGWPSSGLMMQIRT